jgi:very-short-patch-repair endonuclease
VSIVEALTTLGGVATREVLVKAASRSQVDAALAAGDIVALARGRYALPHVEGAMSAAHRLTGVVSHLSAATHWGWEVKLPPEAPEITLPRNRKLTREQVEGLMVHRADLHEDDVTGMVTSPARTLLDCLRTEDEDSGLAVADSALRHGFPAPRLAALARDARGPGARKVRRVAGWASPDAANPFESAVRSIAKRVLGLSVVPQVSIRVPAFLGRPDLVDERLGIIIEADSFEWHGDRAALRSDTKRYNRFVVHGWLVLRFAWEDVMFDPARVAEIMAAAVAERTQQLCPGCRAA